ncbi:MAG: glycosyltransferase [Acidobacteria bacterium]|nr:glycosyltransferase [Acidobacteriota bacterium]
MNVFLERVRPEYLDAARRNCFIPNQEWLHDADREFLPALDRVLFKSAAAMQTLSHECGRSEFLGFVSVDRKRRLCPQAYAALHVGGWNPHKGTAVVCRAWRTGPGWPSLTVVSQLPHRGATAANVRIVSGRISDSRLAEWQNRCGIHICPSEVEGFGHTIAEGLSCGAIVVTTDAPPMNELITPECGILVPYAATEPMRAGTRYLVRDAELQGAVEALSRLGPNVRSQMARAARARFERMRDQFQSRLATIVDNP